MVLAWIFLSVAVIITAAATVPFFAVYRVRRQNTMPDKLPAEAESVSAYSFDGRELCGRLLCRAESSRTAILFHDLRSSCEEDFASLLPLLWESGYDVIMPDARAHGASKGVFTTVGVKESLDVLAWVTTAAQLFGEQRPIYIIGKGMGAYAAKSACAYDFGANVRGVIAQDCYTLPVERIEKEFSSFGSAASALALLAEITAEALGVLKIKKRALPERSSGEPVRLIETPDLTLTENVLREQL